MASEPLFEALLFVFLLSSAEYLRTGSRRGVWMMCVAAGFATLQRYLGVVLLGVMIFVLYRRAGFRALLQGALPWLLAAAPITAWVLLHNYPISGSPFGPRELGAMLPLQNMGLSLTKILWWFVPRWGPLDWMILRPWLPLRCSCSCADTSKLARPLGSLAAADRFGDSLAGSCSFPSRISSCWLSPSLRQITWT